MTLQVLSTRDTPYKGLLPYDEEDAAFFFGRESESDIITANLLASRLTVLYGASGVGKSSVLRAEVAFQLRKLAREEFDTRGQATSAISIYSSWTDDPLAGLRSQIAADVEALCDQSLSAFADLPFHDFLAEAAKLVGGRLLIILDQFEEYFLYSHREGPETFAAEFVRAVNSHECGTNFLISIREDWLARLDRFKTDIPKLFDNYLRIDRLDHESALEAIEGPVRKYEELRKPTDPRVVIAPGFSEAVLSQLERLANKNVLATTSSGEASDKRAADVRIQTPYLQLVMTRLWSDALAATEHVLSPAMLADPDRCEKIIQNHLDEVMDELAPADKEMAASVFKHLVTPSGTKFAQAMSDLAGYADVSPAELSPVMKTLSTKESGVLTEIAPSPGQTDTRYEISTDVLAAAILDWRRRYVDAQEQFEIAQNLSAERERAETEARSARRFRWLAFAMVILSMVAFATAAYALSKRKEAAENRREAAKAYSEAAKWAERAKTSENRAEKLNEENARAKTEFEGYKTESIKEIKRQKQEAAEATKLAALKTAEAKSAVEVSANEVAIRKISNEAKNLYREGKKLAAVRKYESTLGRFSDKDLRGKAGMLFDIGDIYVELIQAEKLDDDQVAALTKGGEAAQELEPQVEDQKEAVRNLIANGEQALSQASKQYEASGDVLFAAKSLVKLGELFGQIEPYFGEEGDAAKSLQYYEGALKTLKQSRSPAEHADERISILSTLMLAAYHEDNPRALKYAIELHVEYSKDPSKHSEQLKIAESIGDLQRSLKQKDAALAAYDEVLRYYESTNNVRRALILDKMAETLYESGDKEGALAKFQQELAALDVANLNPRSAAVNAADMADVVGRIARIQYEQGRKQEAFANYEKATNLYVRAISYVRAGALQGFRDRTQRLAAELSSEFGGLYQAEQLRPEALAAYSRAVVLYESRAAWEDAAKTYAAMAQVAVSMGDNVKAAEFNRKAKEAEQKGKASAETKKP